MNEVADLECDREDAHRVVYHIGEQLVFAFDSINNVSAEVFEGHSAPSSGSRPSQLFALWKRPSPSKTP
jgi:hypothetical protein